MGELQEDSIAVDSIEQSCKCCGSWYRDCVLFSASHSVVGSCGGNAQMYFKRGEQVSSKSVSELIKMGS